MKKIAITPPHFYPGEHLAIVKALNHKFDLVHIRKPNATVHEIESLLNKIPPQFLSKIVIHNHFELASKHNLYGIHINQHSHSFPSNFNGSISRSCHSFEEIALYKDICNYLFLSPIFDSISKKGYNSRFSLNSIKNAHLKGIIDHKVYALGGISPNNISQIKSLGFGGYAMLGSAWGEFTTPPIILTIAGSDCSGGAGIQADIKTISALGGYAASAITALTAQNTQSVSMIEPVSEQMLQEQLSMTFADLKVSAIKIGMIHNSTAAHVIAHTLQSHTLQNIVCDPVMISTSGSQLIQNETIDVVQRHIFPLSRLITPNLHEASMLAQQKIDSINKMRSIASALHYKYGCAVLIKGGHLDEDLMCDILFDGERHHRFTSPKINTSNLHGTGCTLSSAIATRLAFGDDLITAISSAKQYVTKAIAVAATTTISHCNGPLWHHFKD